MNRVFNVVFALVLLFVGLGIGMSIRLTPNVVAAQAGCQRFEQTGHTLCGRFLQYWQQHGGLAQQGYPISEPFSEISDTDGKLYTVQYFERAVFELHPENAAPNDVLLSLLGSFRYQQKYPSGAPKQIPNTLPGSQLFPQTSKRLGGTFLTYWQSHGGLAQQGYPISDEFLETSDTDGNVYKVQYFERAVFEAHPENQAPYDVLLSQLGIFRLHEKYGDGSSLPSAPTSVPFSSGGLGLSREAWEKMHGSSRRPVTDPYPCYVGAPLASYEGGVYAVWYTSGELIAFVSKLLGHTVSVAEARAESKSLLPTDAQLVRQDEVVKYESEVVVYDTYVSQSLSTVYPPGAQNVWCAPDFWNGAQPGTFTVLYDGSGEGNDADQIEIYAGRHDNP